MFRDSLMELERRLRACLCRSTALEILDECGKVVARCSLFDDFDLESLLITVLLETSNLSKHLTETELSSRLYSLFSSCSFLLVPPTLCAALLQGAEPTTLAPLIQLAERGVSSVLVDSLQASLNDDILEWNLRRFVDSLVRMNDVFLAKLKRNEYEEVSLCRRLCTWIENAVFECITKAVHRLRRNDNVNLKAVAYMVVKARNMMNEDGRTLISLILYHCRKLPDCPLIDRVWEAVFFNVSGDKNAGHLVEMIVGESKSALELKRFFGVSVSRSGTLSNICRKLLLQRVCASHIPVILSEYLHLALDKELYRNLFTDSVCLWSDPASLAHLPIPILQYRTKVLLLLGIQTRNENSSDLWENLFPIVARGVQTCLERPEVSVRQLGMLVGEHCSKWMGKEGLQFDYEEDPFTDEMRHILDGVCAHNVEIQDLEQIFAPSLENLCIAKSTELLDSDDEEDFVAYEVPGSEKSNTIVLEGTTEPEKKHAPPLYIGDAIEWLDEKDQYEKFEAAFFALEGLIRRRGMGFSEIADRLLKKIIFIENKFNIKGFEESRRSIIVACLVTQTALVPAIIDVIYSKSCTFAQRFLLLESVILAAKELSEPAKQKRKIEKVDMKKGSQEEVMRFDWRAVIDAKVREKTRYYRNAPKPEVTPSKNRLAPVVDLFVYPLLRIQVEGGHLELQGRDCDFWGRTVLAASEILQYATKTPSVLRISSALADIADMLTLREEPFLKSTALFAYYSIVHCMPTDVFVEAFGYRVRTWIQWTLNLANDRDATASDRKLAYQTADAILSALQQEE